MSYTTIETILTLNNKKILFFDLETSGLPNFKKDLSLPPENIYPSYKKNQHYNSSRILQIGWVYYNDFKFKNEIIVNSVFRKPKDFYNIDKESEKIHGINYEKIRNEGIKLSTILNGDFGDAIDDCEYIIGYNVYFDITILLNELYRLEFTDLINKIENLIKLKQILCIGQLSKQYCRTDDWKQYSIYQIPKQKDVYHFCFDKYPDNQHDAKGDVDAMIDILIYIVENENEINDYYERKKIKINNDIIKEIATNAKIDITKYNTSITQYMNINFLKFTLHNKYIPIYVINLKTLKPTKNSKLKINLNDEIIKKIKNNNKHLVF